MPGHALNREIMAGQPWREERVLLLLEEVLQLLAFVHSQGVIHRDVNPSNLIRRKPDGKLVLIDFGSVKEVANHVTEYDTEFPRTIATGTPAYMPIEQFQGRDDSHPSYHGFARYRFTKIARSESFSHGGNCLAKPSSMFSGTGKYN